MKILIILVLFAQAASAQQRADATPFVRSPDGHIAVHLWLDSTGAPRYSIALRNQAVVRPSKLGLIRDDVDFTRGLRLRSAPPPRRTVARYEILTAKRRHNIYRANRRLVRLVARGGAKLDIVFQASNDGVAFHYSFPDTSKTPRTITEEATSFHFTSATHAWLQPMQLPKTGWGGSNPAYEEFYHKAIAAGTTAPTRAGWVLPALFRSDSVWIVISESSLDRTHAGARLRAQAPDAEYGVGFADADEPALGGSVQSRSTLPWRTPWRIIALGSLATVTESMLGVHVANERVPYARWMRPGKASWSWPLLGDSSANFETQRQFIDYAAAMKWQYCLIDAGWDQLIGYGRMAELVAYARSKGVRLLLWYNSAGDWNTTPQTPRNRLLARATRSAEFARIAQLGIAGVKIDFFGSDAQGMIAYYHDILEDAAAHQLLVNFHGATLPRGWQRTYPHLMTMEAVKGLEFVTFDQRNADEEPRHATMLPFTRNLFDPMDFTPMVLDRIRNIERRTTSAFELALSVLFTSGIQHYAEIPDGMARAPEYVREFLRAVPSVWDDVRFLDGQPGEYVVLARRSGERWWVAGINGDTLDRSVVLDLHRVAGRRAHIITDGAGGNLSFRSDTLALAPGKRINLTVRARGGFVMTLE